MQRRTFLRLLAVGSLAPMVDALAPFRALPLPVPRVPLITLAQIQRVQWDYCVPKILASLQRDDPFFTIIKRPARRG